jgi:hypothetical protein
MASAATSIQLNDDLQSNGRKKCTIRFRLFEACLRKGGPQYCIRLFQARPPPSLTAVTTYTGLPIRNRGYELDSISAFIATTKFKKRMSNPKARQKPVFVPVPIRKNVLPGNRNLGISTLANQFIDEIGRISTVLKS